MLKRRRPREDPAPPLPDRRALEKEMANLHRLLGTRRFGSVKEMKAFLEQTLAQTGGRVPEQAAGSPVEQAQSVMYEAWDAQGSVRVALARRALEISADCADAYVLLAEETAHTAEEARELYAQGVAAGERALGERAFRKELGHFWEVLEARPYMRARAGLAHCLWELGQREAALDHWVDMLRLNPGDSLGVRYRLINGLLQSGRDREAGKLLRVYQGDGGADWLYSWALWAFRTEGDSRRSRRRLTEAMVHNPHVPAYLRGLRPLPRRPPELVGLGDKDEAVSYAAAAKVIWQETPGALDWLAHIQQAL